jgi:hypothetical protein
MADKHPSGNPELVEQHKNIQQKGDEEIAGTSDTRPESQPEKRRHEGDKRPEPDPDTQNSGSGPAGGSSVGP